MKLSKDRPATTRPENARVEWEVTRTFRLDRVQMIDINDHVDGRIVHMIDGPTFVVTGDEAKRLVQAMAGNYSYPSGS